MGGGKKKNKIWRVRVRVEGCAIFVFFFFTDRKARRKDEESRKETVNERVERSGEEET